jgi:hypothetical protein
MATVRFNREYQHKLDKDTTRTWPTGWAGEIADVKIARAAVKAGAAAWIGAAPQLPPEPEAEPKTPAAEKRGGSSKLAEG